MRAVERADVHREIVEIVGLIVVALIVATLIVVALVVLALIVATLIIVGFGGTRRSWRSNRQPMRRRAPERQAENRNQNQQELTQIFHSRPPQRGSMIQDAAETI